MLGVCKKHAYCIESHTPGVMHRTGVTLHVHMQVDQTSISWSEQWFAIMLMHLQTLAR